MAKPTLLVVNPNTSETVTETIDSLARHAVGADAGIISIRAPFGCRYLDSRASVAIACHAVVEAVAGALTDGIRPQAIVLACFGDPAIDALRELSQVPVVGFAEAGLSSAADLDGSFIVATRGHLGWTCWPKLPGTFNSSIVLPALKRLMTMATTTAPLRIF